MPHEIDMTRVLIVTLKEWYGKQAGDKKVERVHLLVGQFTCVEPDLLKTSFAKQQRGTFLEGAELVIRESPFVAYCHGCNAEYLPDIGQEYRCPTCSAPMEDVRSGRELKIDGIDWKDAEPLPQDRMVENTYASTY